MAKKRGWKTIAVRKYLEKHPDANYKQFLADTKINVVDAVFYKERSNLRDGHRSFKNTGNGLIPPNFMVQHKLRGRYEKLAKYLRDHPDVSYAQVLKETGVKVCNSTFNRFKNRCLAYWKNGKGNTRITARTVRKARKMYRPIFTADSSKLSDAAKKLLMNFVESLNESKVGKYEVREYRQPRELEVREVE